MYDSAEKEAEQSSKKEVRPGNVFTAPWLMRDY